MHSSQLLFLSALLPALSLAQSSDGTGELSSAKAEIRSAVRPLSKDYNHNHTNIRPQFKAGQSALSAVVASDAATNPAASAASAYIATAIPSNKYKQQTHDFAPIDYPLATEVPSSLAGYESSLIAAESSAYFSEVTPIVSQYASLFSNGLQSLSSELATESPPPVSTMTGAAPTSATAATATPTSSSAAGATGVPGKMLGAAGVIVAGLGVVAAL